MLVRLFTDEYFIKEFIMKKWVTGILLCGVLILAMGAALRTRISSYRTLDTLASATAAVDTDLTPASGYGTTKITGEVDLLRADGGGKNTYVNSVVLLLKASSAANGDTLTQKLYGRVDGGPPQLIASIVWTIGTARTDGSTATLLWADTAVVTSTHVTTITVADGGGSDRVCSVSLDVQGYRYLHSLITAQTGDPTLITVLYRHF